MKLLNISTRAASLPRLQSVMEQIGLHQGSQCESVFKLIKMSEESLLLISPHCSALSLSLHSVCWDWSAFDNPFASDFLFFFPQVRGSVNLSAPPVDCRMCKTGAPCEAHWPYLTVIWIINKNICCWQMCLSFQCYFSCHVHKKKKTVWCQFTSVYRGGKNV